MREGSVACCGKKLPPLTANKAEGPERLQVEIVENEYYIAGTHPMEKGHYLSFVALLTADSIILRN